MCANFKKSPISPGRFKRGYGIFRRLVVTPTLKLTSAAIKDVKQLNKEGAGNSAGQKPTMSYEQKQDALRVREIGLQQCHEANELFALSISRHLTPLDNAAITKLSSVSGRYLNKGSYCNVDFFDFATEFIKTQIDTVKKEQTRLEYQRAQDLLRRLIQGEKAAAIIEKLSVSGE